MGNPAFAFCLWHSFQFDIIEDVQGMSWWIYISSDTVHVFMWINITMLKLQRDLAWLTQQNPSKLGIEPLFLIPRQPTSLDITYTYNIVTGEDALDNIFGGGI